MVNIETEVKYYELIIKKHPQLKLFLHQTKGVALTAVKALLKLVALEESGQPTSMAKDFDLQLEEDSVYKSMSLYREPRFTKLVDCLSQ